MDNLNSLQRSYWMAFVNSLPLDQQPIAPSVTASFAGNKEITDSLLNLYLAGRKTAGSSVVEDFLTAGDPLPKIGNFWIFLDSSENPRCILRTESTQIHKFNEVPLEVAFAEGEGDLSLEYWRRVHTDIYSPFLKAWGLARIEDATIITEHFKIIYK